VSVETLSGGTVADREGVTDDDGFVVQPVPPDATLATITLGQGSEMERHEMELGRLDPEDTGTGVAARLQNLGYGPVDEDGAQGERTRDALRRFQRDHGLEPTGQADAGTVRLLVERHLS
jgi:peptidoglycan hydrolase-like protein with peptidoglycan-binding domain